MRENNSNRIFLMILLAVAAACASLTVRAQENQVHLIPFRVNSKWGLSNADKKMVVPAKYNSIQQNGDYFILAGDSGDYLYEDNGNLMDSATQFIFSGDEIFAFRVLKPAEQSHYKPKRFQYGRNLQGETNWRSTKPCRLIMMDVNDEPKQKIPGIIMAFNITDGHYFLVSLDHKEGIYNAEKKTFTVSPEYDSIKLIPPDFLLGYKEGNLKVWDEKGKLYAFAPIVQLATSIDTNSLNYVVPAKNVTPTMQQYNRKFLYAQNGKIVLDTSVFWNKLGMNSYIVRNWSKNRPQENSEWLTDAKGRRIIKDIYNHEMSNKRYCKLIRIDTLTKRYHTLGTWDTKENKFSLEFSETPRVEFFPNYVALHYPDSITYFLYDGKYLGSVTDPKLFQKWKELYFNEFTLRQTSDERQYAVYYTIKKTAHAKVAVYDSDGSLICRKYDDIFDPSGSQYLTFRRGNKWGLLNASLKEIIPPIYDTNIRIPWQQQLPLTLFVVKKENRFFYADTTGKILFGGKWFSYIQDRPYNGLWLAFDYINKDSTKYVSFSRKNRIARMYLITVTGEIKKEWDISYPNAPYSRLEYTFTFTTTGKIIQEGAGNGDYIYDPGSGSVKKIPYRIVFSRDLEGRSLLLECKNDKGEMGLINSSDLTIVVPFGQYSHFYANTYAINGKNALLITGERPASPPTNKQERLAHFLNPTGKSKSVIGIYTTDGVKYWE